jgi:hypothetical protein
VDEPEVKKPGAWLPLTPRGVAAFAAAPLRRLWLVQFLAAILAAAAVVWSLHAAWFPAVETAIGNLPDAGDIRVGLLDWRGPETAILAESHFLAFTVNLSGREQPRTTSHVQVELRPRTVKVDSLFGSVEQGYPGRRISPLNRPELQPRWAAWRMPIMALAGVAAVAGLLASWFTLATFYSVPVRVAGFCCNRRLSLAGSWKLCGAALVPGALLLSVGLGAYAAGTLDLLKLTLVFALHFVLPWLLAAVAVWVLPGGSKAAAATKDNPFKDASG